MQRIKKAIDLLTRAVLWSPFVAVSDRREKRRLHRLGLMAQPWLD